MRVAEGWVAWYTRGLPGEVRDARRAELRSDLFEHRRHAAAGGHGRLRWSIQVGGRVYGSTLDPWQDPASVVRLAAFLAPVGMLASVLMLAGEYARRWRRRRRARSGE